MPQLLQNTAHSIHIFQMIPNKFAKKSLLTTTEYATLRLSSKSARLCVEICLELRKKLQCSLANCSVLSIFNDLLKTEKILMMPISILNTLAQVLLAGRHPLTDANYRKVPEGPSYFCAKSPQNLHVNFSGFGYQQNVIFEAACFC